MAPTFKHGKDSVVYAGTAARGENLGDILNSFSVDATVDTADATCFGDDDRNYVPGLRTATVSMNGLADGSTARVDQLIEGVLGSTSRLFIGYGPEGDAVGSRAYLASLIATQHNVEAPVSGIVATAIAGQADGLRSPGVGRFLAPLAARSAGSTFASVDDGAASAAGGEAHVYVTAYSTSGTATAELAVTIQDSSNNSVWGTLATLTVNSATFKTSGVVLRSTLGPTVKRYVRARSATQGSTSITYAVAYARHPN
jgi:hypothetical protein